MEDLKILTVHLRLASGPARGRPKRTPLPCQNSTVLQSHRRLHCSPESVHSMPLKVLK